MAKITIVDCGIGNLLKVVRAVRNAGGDAVVATTAGEISTADFLILPGVGAFSHGMQVLNANGLSEAIHKFTNRGRPFMGICLGMQFMLSKSEEFGVSEGLDLIPGKVCLIPSTTVDGQPHRIPLVGWMPLRMSAGVGWNETPLSKTKEGEQVYFVHSYAAVPDNPANRLAEIDYHGHTVCAAIHHENLFGFQFHPEMSASVGRQIFTEFISQ